MSFPKIRRNHFPSPVHNLMVVEELESENYAGRVKPEIGPKGKKMKLFSIHWTNHKSELRRCCSCCVDGTYTARGSVKTSVWMCIIRSPPAVYSITKHTCSGVWKHANRLTRKGWCDMFTISKMRFSHIKLREEPETGSGRVEETHTYTHTLC